MKARARELGLSDTKVAELAGLSQTRYATYVIDKFEPDLTTLIRICKILQVTPHELIGWLDDEKAMDVNVIISEMVTNASELKPSLLIALNEIVLSLTNNSKKLIP